MFQPFDIDVFTASIGEKKEILRFHRNQTIFSQGQPSFAIFLIDRGNVKLSASSKQGKEAILGVFGPGQFLGESCLTSDRPIHLHTATALTDVRVVKIGRHGIVKMLRRVSEPFYGFISSLLCRSLAIQANFTDNLMESSEARLGRALVSLARLNEGSSPPYAKITQQDWANMIGISRQRVNGLLQKFRNLGLIDDSVRLKVNKSILEHLSHYHYADHED